MAENDFVPNLGAGSDAHAELDKLLAQSGAAARPVAQPTTPVMPGMARGAKKTGVVLGVTLLVLLVIGGTLWLVLNLLYLGRGEIVLELNQTPASLTIDGKSYGSIDTGDSFKLKSGEHTLMVEKAGFLTVEDTFTLERKGKKTLTYELLPVPQIVKVAEGAFKFSRLNADGSEISYWDFNDKTFKTINLASGEVSTLFSGSFEGVADVAWSPTTQAAVVKMAGRPNLARTIDNRNAKGRYIPFGDSPVQGPARFNGFSNWLFDDSLRPASGWQPVALTDNMREVVFSADGGQLLYLYETASGEYSLVRGLPDGREWERLIVDVPRLDGAKLSWSPDGRYLLAEVSPKLYLIDTVNKLIQEVFQDRVGTYSFSPDGDKIAYISRTSNGIKLATYDLIAQEAKVVEGAEVNDKTLFTWLDDTDILLALPNQSFVRIDTEKGKKTTIPFTGTDTNFQIRSMQYSKTGHVLMLLTDSGIFALKV